MSKSSARTGTKENACCVFDFTLFQTENNTHKQIIKDIKELVKAYCFQLEKGSKTNKQHYQGRFSLKEKKREHQVIKILKDLGWEKFHISVTSKANRDNNFYVCKDDTRVDGPWDNEHEERTVEQVEYMEKHGLRPWQQSTVDLVKPYDRRHIEVIFDVDGNIGKSYFTLYMMCKFKAKILPPMKEYRDILRAAYCVGPQDVYMFDMPRALPKSKLDEMYAAIETLKSGYCYEDRNHFRDLMMPHPNILIFTNKIPDLSLLSRDRWRIWTIVDLELHKWVPPPNEQSLTVEHIGLLANEERENCKKVFNAATEDEALEIFEKYFYKYCNTFDEIRKQIT